MRKPSAEPNHDRTGIRWALAERLLGIPASMRGLQQPEEFVEGAAHAAAAALGVDVVVRWSGLSAEPLPPPDPRATRLKVLWQDSPFAAIDLMGEESFTPEVEALLRHMAADLTHDIDALTNRTIRYAQRALVGILRAEDEPEVVAHNAVAMVVERVGAEAGLLLNRHTESFGVLAAVGAWPEEAEGASGWRAAAHEGITSQHAVGHPGDLVTCPISSTSPARFMLLLRFPAGGAERRGRYPVLDELARTAAPYMDARRRDLVLTELLELNRVSESTATVELYGKVLKTAVDLIPGAEAGSLLTRDSPSDAFEYQAAIGFDLGGLRSSTASEVDMRAWYGPEERGWRLGLPRLLTRADVDIDLHGIRSSPGADLEAAAYHSIQATICLPVLRDGVVMAALNLDNLTDRAAFGRDSTNLAHLFGSPLSSLLHRQQTRDVLRRAALIDDLTNLGNRRAFDQALAREIARAARSTDRPSVLLLDLRDFKLINDRLGHAVGDEALALVARALERGLRATDFPARRGGDEFVALLPDTTATEAAVIGERVQAEIAKLVIHDTIRLHANIGVATAPDDGKTAADLLRVADERMYLEKLGAR